MKKRTILIAMVLFSLCALTALGFVGNPPQQQTSGGAAVTVTSGTVTANQGGTWTMQPGNTANTTAWLVTGTGGNFPISGSISNTAFGVSAGTAKIGITYPYTSCGTTSFTSALQAMPTSSTAIATSTTCILGFEISNTSGGSLTVTISDNQGSPVVFLSAVSIGAGETRTYNWPNGRKFTSGVKVQASGAGIVYALEGLQ